MFGSNQGSNSTPSSGGLFGNAASTTPASTAQTGLFGAQKPGLLFSGTAAAKSGGIFGSPAPTGISSIFGAQQAAPTTTAPASGGIFGSTSQTTAAAPTSGGLFGQKSGVFGSGQGSTSSGGLLGTASQPTSTTSSGLFGNAASTSTAPQTSGLFGSSTTSVPQTTGLFGTAPSTTTAAPAAPSGGLFGSTAQSTAPASSGLFGTTNQTAPAVASGGLFGGVAPVSTAPQTSGLFGSAATTAAPSTAQGGLFGGQKPVETAQVVAAAPTVGLFGSAAIKTQASSGGLFGTAAQPTPTAASSSPFVAPTVSAPPAAPSAAPQTGAPQTGALFGAPALPITAVTTIPTQAPTTTASATLFGSTTPAAPTVSVPQVGVLFGSAATAAPLSGQKPATSTAAEGLFGTATSSATPTTVAAPSSTTTAPLTSAGALFGTTATSTPKKELTSSLLAPIVPKVAATKPVSFGELEKIVNNLVMDVLGQEKLFLNQTLEINSYDREIRDNQAKLIAADKEVAALEESRDRLAHNLNFIDMQQKELDSVISDLEKKLGLPDWTDCGQNFPIDLSYATSADQQRTNIMKLLTSVDAQIKEADDDINEINEQLISMNKSKDPNSDDLTVEQIQKVLKKQLENIIWVDKKSEEISEKASKLAANYASMPDA